MSRPLLKLSGGSVDDYATILRRFADPELSVAGTERGDQRGHFVASLHAPEPVGRFEHGRADPAKHHRAAAPAFDVPLDVTGATQEALDRIGRGQRPLQPLGQPERDHGERLVEPFPDTGGRTRMLAIQPAGEVLQAPAGRLDVGTRIGAREDRPDPRPLHLREMLEHVAPLVDLTTLHQGGAPERLGDRGMQRLPAVEDDQQTAFGAEPAALQVGQQALTHGRVFGRALPEAQGVFCPRGIDAKGDDDTVPADVHAVDQQRGEVEVLQRRGPPSVQLRLGLRHEAPTDGALTRAAGAHVRTQRFQTAPILARRHADEHLFDDAAVERVRERLDRGQGQLLAVAPDPRSSDRDLAAPQYDLARRMPGPIRTALGLVRIPRTTDGNPILFQHRLEYLQARGDDQLLELGLRVHEDVDQREVPLPRGLRLATASGCARLLLHGGSFLGALPQVVPPAV